MKTQAFVLFIAYCLAGCATQLPTKPTTIENVGHKSASDDSSWPTLESNRASEIMIQYRVLDDHGVVSTYSGFGFLVGPHALITNAYIISSIRFPQILLGVSVVLRQGDWSEIPATIVAHMDSGSGVELLVMNGDLPDVRSVVFGKTAPGITAGYFFGNDLFPPYNTVSGEWIQEKKVEPVFVLFPQDDVQRCDALDQLDPHIHYGYVSFDTKHRLVCFYDLPASVLERFLYDNGVSVNTK